MGHATPAEPASPRRLAEFLRERKTDILAEWEGIVRQTHVAQSLERPVLLDHLPEFLDDLVLYVDEARAGHRVEPPEQYPRIHALERLEVGYDLAEVVAEYSALRRCITTLFAREHPPSLRSVEMPRLHEAIDQAISASVVRYSEARERTLKALDRISSAALVHHDVATLLPSMLDVLLQTTASVDSVVIFLRDGDELSVRASVGLDEAGARLCKVRIGECFAGRIAASRAPLFTRDASHDQTITCDFLRTPGTHALFGVPLELGGDLIGVAIMGSRTAYEFSQEDQFLFRTMATRATALLAQANLADEAAARLAELEAVIESISEGVFVGDASGIRRTNAAGLKMLGFDSLEQLRRKVPELEAAVDTRSTGTGERIRAGEEPFLRALRGESLTTDLRIRNAKTGVDVVLRSASAPIRLGDRIIGAVTVNSDITERSREERELRAALNFRDRVLGVLSHDLRNPLGVVVTSAQLLQRAGTLDESQARSVRRIADNAKRMEQLIHDLLDYTRARQGNGIPVAPRACDLLQLCNQIIDNLRVLHPDRVVLLTAEGDPRGEWDPERALQVVSNLVTNAVRYSPPDTPVRLSLRDLGTEVVLEVHNAGTPIPADVLPTIFEAFQRGGPGEAGPGGGLGLGLYIVQQLVAAHGGTVDIHSTAADGTTFSVHWPRAAK